MDRKRFTLRLTNEQLEALERKANEEGMTKNEYLSRHIEERGAREHDLMLDKLDEILALLKKEETSAE